MSSSLTLEALQVLDAIARRGSFAAAAQELNRAPSSLSYQVQKLEQDLDLVIFDRSGHKAVFTEAGQLLLNRGRILLSAANDLVEDANILAHGWELEISIAYDLLPIQFFFPLVHDLSSVSKSRVKLQEEVLAGSWEALSYDRADILICPKPEHIPIDVKIETLGNLDMVWVAAPKHIVHKRTSDFGHQTRKKYRAIAIADSARTAPRLSRNLVDDQPRLTVSNFPVKIESLCAGLGIGTLPRYVANPLIEQKKLAIIEGSEVLSFEMVIAWRRNKMGKAKSWCIQYLKKYWKISDFN
ncbi:LysR family transcriptional regulator [Vibrio casei]|uniref:LysR family transcriptional regulator n=1 Tax=Vibrio casei TaxID=673372 RepID=A0A368LHS6_9VIBR|nr:LysR family transcriptional regulator [Vibrio casei]RCS70221.1 LysR family transcriptional regulator [Vibrio casei]SJN25560.1 Transcriptional regulator, LysR family [Vibrio casei]